MAYNYFPNYQSIYPYQNTIPANMAQNQQIQNGGFISVRSEEEARNYPIAPGNSVTFRNEAEPYIYTKTMGFSQLDRPVFEKFRLIKETDEKKPEQATQEYTLKADFEALKADFLALKTEIDEQKVKKNPKERKLTDE